MPDLRSALLPLSLFLLTAASPPDQVNRVTITRDDWGIAHVHGKTDADAVFGAIYAQAEDDFPRIEANYLTALGRTAEAALHPILFSAWPMPELLLPLVWSSCCS
jgi:acyl-homoserine-lactone acylase